MLLVFNKNNRFYKLLQRNNVPTKIDVSKFYNFISRILSLISSITTDKTQSET